MSIIERHTEDSANERLQKQLPEISQKLDTFWHAFANRSIGFAGSGNISGGLQPRNIGREWLEDVSVLLVDCTIDINNFPERIEWGEMIVSLSDLSDELRFYWSPSWEKVSNDERSRTLTRMDMNAQRLLNIFKERGFIDQEQKPFNLDDE